MPIMKYVAVVVVVFLCPGLIVASPGVNWLSPQKCISGLHSQPAGGPFAVYVFCDGALGINIAVINISPGAGPGTIKLEGPKKEWGHWYVNDRLWQEAEWATDVNSFVWSADLRLLYVATSGIYGSGAVYRLDLVARTTTKILPTPSDELDPKYTTTARIERIIPATGEIVASLARFDPSINRELTTLHTLK